MCHLARRKQPEQGDPVSGRDIIVLGASTGGVEALSQIAAGLPEDLPAAVFAVLHIPPSVPSHLPYILSRVGPLKSLHPANGQRIEQGQIYVAPPGQHLLVERGHIHLTLGPRENHHRPAVDPLFRSAARSYGPRVIGGVLSGALNDGTAGLLAIKRRGGATLVQDPEEAVAPGMPASALEYVQVDHCVPLQQIAPLLSRLAREEAPNDSTFPISPDLEQEARIAAMDLSAIENSHQPGRLTGYTCPECKGPLWEIQDSKLVRYRCRVGHAYTAETVLEGKDVELEDALWAALNTLEEGAQIARTMAQSARQRGHVHLVAHYEHRAATNEQHMDVLRSVLARGERAVPDDGAQITPASDDEEAAADA